MDNRLDFIDKFEYGAVDLMTRTRKKFIDLDLVLLGFIKDGANPASIRALSIARTNIETALQYAIKGICLKYEKKDE